MNLPAASYRELQVKINKKPAISNGFLDFIGLSCDEGDRTDILTFFNYYIKNKIFRYSSVHQGAFKHIDGRMLRVSTIGRTFLDMLRKPDYCGSMYHVAGIFKNNGQQYSKLIIDEIDRHGTNIEKARAGYLLEEVQCGT